MVFYQFLRCSFPVFFYFAKVKENPAKPIFFPRKWPTFTKKVAECYYPVVLEELLLSKRKLPTELEILNLKIIRQKRTNSGSCTSYALNTAITLLLQKNWVAAPILVMFKDKLYL